MIKIAPSILSADFGRMNEEIKEIEDCADLLHVDVMDGHFVPNLTIGPVVVRAIKTKLPVDVHLMISDPVKYAKEFSPYCSMISFHAELFENNPSALRASILAIRKLGVKVGLVLNPDKDLPILLPVLDMTDFILIMSVYAGFGGQKFIPEVLQKIRDLRSKYGYEKGIEIDGGINKKTIGRAVEAGANIIVAGSAIFGQKDRKKAIEELRG
ncbi:ribulose-phosphate 3-epimerase [Candidatus Woesearchaeota archaeon]|nr:ribulose-phosphate 3-epimerase [Candidatus Woesearchaeota archaeon]